MIDGHIHIERGEYSLEWIDQFLNKAVEMKLDEISINGDTVFSENVAYRPDAEIIIVYHTFKRNAD